MSDDRRRWGLAERARERTSRQGEALRETFPGSHRGEGLPTSPTGRTARSAVPPASIGQSPPYGRTIHVQTAAGQVFDGGGTACEWTSLLPGIRGAGFGDVDLPTDRLPIPLLAYYRLDLSGVWQDHVGGGRVQIVRNGVMLHDDQAPFGSTYGPATFALGVCDPEEDDIQVVVSPVGQAGVQPDGQAGRWEAALVLVEKPVSVSSPQAACVFGDWPWTELEPFAGSFWDEALLTGGDVDLYRAALWGRELSDAEVDGLVGSGGTSLPGGLSSSWGPDDVSLDDGDVTTVRDSEGGYDLPLASGTAATVAVGSLGRDVLRFGAFGTYEAEGVPVEADAMSACIVVEYTSGSGFAIQRTSSDGEVILNETYQYIDTVVGTGWVAHGDRRDGESQPVIEEELSFTELAESLVGVPLVMVMRAGPSGVRFRVCVVPG